ncbi:hypothetical protein VE02_05570 [Pseudogymnoascus sp. 03VT05]|nr:hypothetical protein VE02_05570 [Pseudogymnoascus sp. 03VT05]
MLYMKESIDAGAKKAKEEAKLRRDKRRKERADAASAQSNSTDADGTSEPKHADDEDTDDEEDVIVRGFSGNAVRTEKGIKYLGKRLAKYVLAMTYPDQPFHSVSISAGESFKAAVTHDKSRDVELGEAVHPHSSIREDPPTGKKLAYTITSISFIAHSLGGLIQTYAVAYIQKHSPDFFDKIQAVNFICLASPFLGLSNENPLYVKFALDFGLVGRTGQDLGLTWRAPTLARSGWGALVGGIGENGKKAIEHPRDPRSKPLLRILPTGPAHVALKKFRNRTAYSNVVNDGIVPLRTSCLLFLDWQGLGRVEKARRENGLVGTMAGWGWAELTGQNATAAARQEWMEEAKETEAAQASQAGANGSNTPTRQGRGGDVPQPPPDATEDDVRSLKSMKMPRRSTSEPRSSSNVKENELHPPPQSKSQSPPITGTATTKGPIDSFLDFFNPRAKSPDPPRQSKIYKRSQTVKFDEPSRKPDSKTDSSGGKTDSSRKSDSDSNNNHTPSISSALPEDPQGSAAPPRTSFFEAAGDILSPPLPPLSFLIDPSTRPLTIFHDRVYHPSDIPPPPLKPPTTTSNKLSKTPPASNHSTSSIATTASDSSFPPLAEIDSSAMKVEEKIARAYHRDLAWRKVLVRLEPDAHNNIIVRRKFANAYGWPVVQHLVDTHFAAGGAAVTPDDEEGNEDRAAGKSPRGQGGDGEEEGPAPHQFLNQALMREREEEDREGADHLSSLSDAVSTHTHTTQRIRKPVLERADSEVWSERDFMDSEGDSDGEVGEKKGKKGKKEEEGGQAWNWTEKIVGRGAVGRGAGKGGGAVGVGKGMGGRGHKHKESREYTVPSPEEDEDEDDGVGGAGEVEGVSKGLNTMNLGVQPVAASDTSVGIVEEVARASVSRNIDGGGGAGAGLGV